MKIKWKEEVSVFWKLQNNGFKTLVCLHKTHLRRLIKMQFIDSYLHVSDVWHVALESDALETLLWDTTELLGRLEVLRHP